MQKKIRINLDDEFKACWNLIKNEHNTHVFITYALLTTDSKKQNKS